MRYQEIITEVFDTAAGLTWVQRDEKEQVAELSIADEVKYRFSFLYRGMGLWSYRFDLMLLKKPDTPWGYPRWDAFDTIKPGYGKPFAIFAAATEALIEFCTTVQPKTLYFTAAKSQPSRVKLYRVLLDRFTAALPAYDGTVLEGDREVAFKLTRREVIGEAFASPGRWSRFLQLLERWTTFHSDEYEDGGKKQIERILLGYADIAAQFQTVHEPRLYRGTGLHYETENMLRDGQSVAMDTSWSVLTSWTSEPKTALHFAGKFGGAILMFPREELSVFLSIPAVWQAMTAKERKNHEGIAYGNREAEVLVRLPQPHITVTPANILEFVERVEDEEDVDSPEAEDAEADWDDEATLRAIPVAQARQELIQLGIKHHPDKGPDRVKEMVAQLADGDVYRYLAGYRRRT